MNRVSFSDSVDGSDPYVVWLNPSSLELNVDDYYESFETLDGGNVKQKAYFDSRPYIMRWEGIPGTVNSKRFPSLCGTLYSYKGETKYVNFKDIDYAIPTLGWTKVIVENVQVTTNRGGALKYNLTVKLSPQV